ncbi:hypothetical protein QR680_008386 [Steinernema hermaphroditum]|uniref:ZP domain-containing protein n=1 Tax=Steinernema hermaphroditum TaxID=289476 RepID=A0AA39M6Y1_9BILA|nr:hypothetical protein QR680_008386 [Steinernema hermaphroditum]
MSSRQRTSTSLASSAPRTLRVLLVSLLAALLDSVGGNEVVGEPFISCAADAIYAKWRTNTTFTGHVNVRSTPNRFCYQVLVTNNQIELLVPHRECNVNRIRSLNPPGIILETSVLISFHSEFVTEGDRVYVLKCFHTRPQKSHEKLEDGRPHKEVVEAPKTNVDCQYNVKNAVNGEVAKRLIIGEKVFHEWSCEGARDDQCLLVTSCFLVTHDSKHKLVDASGCSMDRTIVPEFEYVNNSYVGQLISVFGIAQKPFVHFQCQLSLVDSVKGLCPIPDCEKDPSPKAPQRRDIASYLLHSNASILDALSQRVEILEVGAERRSSSDEEAPSCGRKSSAPSTEIRRAQPPEGTVCVSKISFGAVAIATIAVAIFTLVVVLVAMVQRFRGSHDY